MQALTPNEAASKPHDELSAETLVKMHDIMLKSRLLEERLIRMQKQGDGYFWIGGPGEEAFNTALGMLIHKGEGVAFDYMHLHYRSSATMVALGADPVDALRQMKNVAADPYSGGRNFAGHYSIRKWNVVPVSSPIEVQYSMAPGTALAQKRFGGKGITIVQGGDAGTAEADFAACLVWSSRPGTELPVLMIVTNNQWGISTPANTQHGEKRIADRGKAFGIKTMVIEGNDPETAHRGLKEAMEYVRNERKPLLLEASVSRLYGHSSSSGANFIREELDCVAAFEEKLEKRGILSRAHMDGMRAKYTEEYRIAAEQVRQEPQPEGESIWRFVFSDRDITGDHARATGGVVPHGASREKN